MLCPSAALRRGAIARFALGSERIVLFRGRDTGRVHALPGFCLHQGVDLAQGSVVGDRLRCPLHHWEYSDRCERIPGLETVPRSSPRYAVTERFGMLFAHLGPEPASGVPGFSVDDRQLAFRSGKAVEVDCPWYVPIANAFDMIHLRTVHRRALTSEIEITCPDPATFMTRYTTSVLGNGWSDRSMRKLSGDDIRVKVISSGGALLMVESSIRRWRGYLMVGLRPTARGVSLLPLFGVPRTRTGLHALYVRFSAALFTAFLMRDVAALSGIRFPAPYVDDGDPTITACYRYLCNLPSYESEES
jgi:nitrite reductase/ring-hydroxylating ferredoxin subunit